MKFVEVTHRMLGVALSMPGHEADQKTVAEALPSMQTMRVWRANHGGYSWVISYDPGHQTWSEEERSKWAGYSASYRREGLTGSSQTIPIDGGPWQTLTAAEGACKQRWRQIRNLS